MREWGWERETQAFEKFQCVKQNRERRWDKKEKKMER